MLLDQTVKKSNRIREVIQVLVRYGFEDIVTTTALKRFIPTQNKVNWIRAEKSIFELTRWERIRMVIEELGPTFVKLAQMISNRPELLPTPLVEEFQKLQDKVPPFEGKIAREIIAATTGKTISETFSYFDEVPIGSASIGQVHRARLLTGEDVVVKIQRPKIKTKILTDLALMKDLIKILENYFKKNGILNPLEIAETFEKSMHNELDYSIEANNIINFRKMYENEDSFYVPEVYKSLSNKKILVIEFIGGCKITDVEQLKLWGLEPEKIAEKGLDIYLKQIFEFGYFHADPHPGNVLIKPDGTVVLIDFGMTGKLTKQNKYAFAGVFIGLAQQDAKGMAINLRRLAIDGEIEEMRSFENDLNELIEDMIVFPNEEDGMTELTFRLQKIIYKYQLKVPGDVFLILRALAILEGIGLMLHPNFQTLEFIKPYGKKLVKEQYSTKNLSLDLYYTLTQISSLFYVVPSEIRTIIRKLRKGDMNVNIELSGFDHLSKIIDVSANKISTALIIAALVIGSSLSVNMPYNSNNVYILGMPLISFIGFNLALFLSIYLLLYMLRKRN
ncbi:ABC1 kinase family protein [Chondrinema litorale]|uniref:ABC1 kinase family protein n=1 Tax=Chondrinema litorale TaxID=2994555 RepID=UPI002543EA9F|nr:AarF/ABC1/UbiB kinase family protein [Chondrinema litorale]UZR92829.1 AarF/ABC1/UbiB kinase family protein [Chondrinema litorale]